MKHQKKLNTVLILQTNNYTSQLNTDLRIKILLCTMLNSSQIVHKSLLIVGILEFQQLSENDIRQNKYKTLYDPFKVAFY